MSPKKLIVIQNTHDLPPSTDETMYIYRRDLGAWLRNGKFFARLFNFSETRLSTFSIDTVINPLITLTALRFLSRNSCIIEDSFGKEKSVSFFDLFLQLFIFIKEFVSRSNYYKSKEKQVDHFLGRYSNKKTKQLNLDASPVYLRTDFCYGLSSGGSVGHTVGVANNLGTSSNPPIMISTVFFPMLSEHIKRFQLKPSSRFLNFQELFLLGENDFFTEQAQSFLKNTTPSFIYHRSSLLNYSGVLLSKEYEVPLVLEYNGSEIWANRNWGSALSLEAIGEKTEEVSFKFADVIVVVSDPLKKELVEKNIPAEKIMVNPNGVDADLYHPDVDGTFIREKYDFGNKCVIGFIGTFGKWHGAEVLAKAFGILLNKNPSLKGQIKLLMVGDGICMDLVCKEISNAGIESEVTLTGLVPQQEGPAYLAACDIFASPHVPNPDGSPFFGSPTKLFEYMAMGRGIVASDLDQIGLILDHEKTALLVSPGDADSLAEGLKTLIEQPELRKQLGKAAREEVVAKYTWREHTRKIVDALKKQCQNR